MAKFKNYLASKLLLRTNRDRIFAFLQKNSTAVGQVLDLGSAGRPYRQLFPTAISLDISPVPGISVQADAHRLPFKSAVFDTIVTTEVLEHLERPQEAIAEMSRTLKPQGKLILTTRFIFPIHGAPQDYFRYTKFGLKSLFSEWNLISLTEETTILETLAILFQRLGLETQTRPQFLRFLFFIVAKTLSLTGPIIIPNAGERERLYTGNVNISSGYHLVCRKHK